MATETYDVKARFQLKEEAKTRRQLSSLSDSVKNLGSQFRSVQTNVGGLFGKLMAVGGAYVGINALTNAVRSFSSKVLETNQNVEDMIVALSGLMASAERISFAQAQREAGGLFRQLNDIAVQSPATAQDLMGIFRGVYGPLRRAGTGMQDLLTFSRDAASVGAMLQVDYEQLSRDIAGMATGVAGLDNKTFRLLRSMGLITEDTKAWNKMATEDSARAARRLLEVFEQLGGPAAQAFGRTWTGVSSTFKGIVQNLVRIFTGPAFRVITLRLKAVNEFLLKYRSRIESVLARFGTSIAEKLDRVFDKIQAQFRWIFNNFDKIKTTFDAVLKKFDELKPLMATIAKIMLALKAVTIGFAAATGLANIAGGLGLGAGGAAAGTAAGAGAAGAGGILAGLLTSLSTAVAPVLAIFSALASGATMLWLAVTEYGDAIRTAFEGSLPIKEMFADIVDDLKVFADGLWEFIKPIWAMVGSLVIQAFIAAIRGAFGVLKVFTGILRTIGVTLKMLAPIIRPVADALHTMGSAVIFLIGELGNLIKYIGDIPNKINQALGIEGPPAAVTAGAPMATMRQPQVPAQNFARIAETIRTERPTTQPTNIDMRNSRIVVNQEFADADPDRVWIQMRNGLEGEINSRTQSAFVNPFAR